MKKIRDIKIAPSILAADFASIKDGIETINKNGADYIHCDIMDGKYVPEITFGSQMIKAVREHSDLTIDAHLMVMHPERHINRMVGAGANIITFHPETTNHPHGVLMQIKKLGALAGIVLNPGTSVSSVRYLLDECDIVLLMSVNPGFGGQNFIENTLDKARELSKFRDELKLDFDIEIDGGVNVDNAEKIRECGVNVLVAGTAFFAAENPAEFVAKLKGDVI